MKRLFVFFIIIVSVALCFVVSPEKDLSKTFHGEYTIYLNNRIEDVPGFVKIINNGQGQILSCDLSLSSAVQVEERFISGKSIKLDKNEYSLDTVKSLLQFDCVSSYAFPDEIETYYGLSSYGDKCVFIKNKKVNCEIAVNKDNIIVGFPIILGSY